ncbi:MAG: hypothetical protein EOM34_15935 [Clostridia bacterium]|uniref:Uncharacterized protein n=1 Tax=Hespellia stercorisuis DSM 15480 TaxID=1121950 RepID=A0A1M6QSF5_9FIRM|nr:hypothetical protein [Hespellia stercorisuis]MDD3185902.1 hypothetical protein [Anaerostipes sp.]NCC02128.1 hypothetical protein [Clostridia bacterium]MDD4369886.1 hypothetical protein [Anaerostipes sp.]NCD04201.1 hypothetical protein [Clostridia bacterium]SHK23085.1 hypothetical protein SAMN02745243_02506 [Hespellia stercorisuis DSM 15480]
MKGVNNIVRTPRKGARLGNRTVVDGKIVLHVKSGKLEDYVTAEEIVEELVGVPVDHIVFQSDMKCDH